MLQTKRPGNFAQFVNELQGAPPSKIGVLYGTRNRAAVVGADPEYPGLQIPDSGSSGGAHRAPPGLVSL